MAAQKKVGLRLNLRPPIHLGGGGSKQKVAPSKEYRARPVRVTAVPGRALEEYDLGDAHVIIADDGEKYLYLVEEPALTDRDQELYALIMESLYYSLRPVETQDLMAHIDSFVWQVAEDLGIVDDVKEAWPRLRYYVRRDSVGYGVIDVPMRDPRLEEVSCTGPGRPVAVVHRNYPAASWLDTNIQFADDEEMRRFVQRLMQRAGKSVTIARPLGDAMTKEGHRVAVTLGNEITLPGSTFSIRKFTEQPLTITYLVAHNTLPALMAAYLWIILEQKGFTFVVGGTGSGKTTTMNALLGMLDPRVKIATIEETPELNLPHTHWERLVARISYMGESKFDIGLFDLTRLSLRLRPDYVVVGEARGEEIQALYQSAASGHGALSSFHADSPQAALVRMSAPPLNVGEAAQMLIWAMVMMNRVRLPGGEVVRRAIQVTEVQPETGEIRLQDIFTWDARSDTFEPDDPEEIRKRSTRLATVERLTGMDAVEEMRGRASFIEELARRGAFDYRELAKEFSAWYRRRYGGSPQGPRLEPDRGR
ncbi:type II/IV secretion system ATPase subunit [Conexivisphaera calida]|uniref:Flagella-related protein FlaI n=1 Tax=Conexivisphaera calida TaxID=1874277 RepID=A0A4V0P1P3_9ARCH|nr:type II/IV secretion system ATPase subunit [Conexivisphaera calida]BBE42420.1 Flagella-related protein FlaI [Conexivisphaera calida]